MRGLWLGFVLGLLVTQLSPAKAVDLTSGLQDLVKEVRGIRQALERCR